MAGEKPVYKRKKAGNGRVFFIKALAEIKNLVPGNHLLPVMVLVRLGIHGRSTEGMVNKDQDRGYGTNKITIVFAPEADGLSDQQNCGDQNKYKKEYGIAQSVGNPDQISLIQVIVYQPDSQKSRQEALQDQD